MGSEHSTQKQTLACKELRRTWKSKLSVAMVEQTSSEEAESVCEVDAVCNRGTQAQRLVVGQVLCEGKRNWEGWRWKRRGGLNVR
jgi:hypothetical protein